MDAQLRRRFRRVFLIDVGISVTVLIGVHLIPLPPDGILPADERQSLLTYGPLLLLIPFFLWASLFIIHDAACLFFVVFHRVSTYFQD